MTIQIERVVAEKWGRIRFHRLGNRDIGRFRPEQRFVMRNFWEDPGHLVVGQHARKYFILAVLFK